jgi:hypothetical protein
MRPRAVGRIDQGVQDRLVSQLNVIDGDPPNRQGEHDPEPTVEYQLDADQRADGPQCCFWQIGVG